MEIAFFIWAMCGILGGVIASQKGRSVGGWVILCLLLGPLGVILALVVSQQTGAVEERALASGASKKCPQCAEIVKADAVKCRYCGSELPIVQTRPCFQCGAALGPEFVADRTLPCPRCGRKNPLARPVRQEEQFRPCPHCDKNIPKTVDQCLFCHQAVEPMAAGG